MLKLIRAARNIAGAATLLAMTATCAQAADMRVLQPEPGAAINVPIVFLEGPIEYGDSDKFEDLVLNLPRRSIVVLTSPGGSLDAGIKMGRTMRRLGLRSLVADTCASACALAWLGGVERLMTPEAKVGFHVAYMAGPEMQVTGQGNALIGHYVGELGFQRNVVEYVTTAAPADMQWLSFRDASLLGVDVSQITLTQQSADNTPPDAAPGPSSTAPAAPGPAAPATPAPAQADPTQVAAIELVAKFLAPNQSDLQAALNLVQDSYAPTVHYYGKQVPFADVLADKQKYLFRWPIRDFRVKPETVKVQCSQSHCFVAGEYDWTVSNPVKNRTATGTSTFDYTLERQGGLKIVGEFGQVMKK